MIDSLPRDSEDLRWLAGILWAGSNPTTRAAASGERYIVVPSLQRPRALLPADRPGLAAESLRRFNALRPWSVRLPRALLATALDLPLLRSRLGARITIPPTPGDSLLDHLRSVLEAPDASMTVGIGARAPNRKPVVQLTSAKGEPIAFAKIGWNPFTRALVEREAATLGRWASHAPRRVSVPRLLHAGAWHDLQLCVAAPLPSGVRGYPARLGPPDASVLREVSELDGTRRAPLIASAFWAELRERLLAPDALPEAAHDAAEHGLDRLATAVGDEETELASWHGDWVPWNLAREGSRLHVFDWEHAAPDRPLGLDLQHFHFQVELLLRGRSVSEAMARAGERSRIGLRELGVRGPLLDALPELHLFELVARAADARRLGAGTNPRLFPGLLALLAGGSKE